MTRKGAPIRARRHDPDRPSGRHRLRAHLAAGGRRTRGGGHLHGKRLHGSPALQSAGTADPRVRGPVGAAEHSDRRHVPRRACGDLDGKPFGMVAGNTIRSGRVGRGHQAGFVMDAPAGATLVGHELVGEGPKAGCRYAIQMYPLDANGSPVKVLGPDRPPSARQPPSGERLARGR
jgi:hypothetical protein